MRTYSAAIERCPQTGPFAGFAPGRPGAHAQGATEPNRNQALAIPATST
jgi:predicted RNase H-like HicB family nuclease